jgi:hypothetical protein
LASEKVDDGLGERLLLCVQASRTVGDLREYWADKPWPEGFSGRWFESIGGGGDQPAVANRITGTDIVAVAALSVRIPIWMSWRLLESDSDEIESLLAHIPRDQDLWVAVEATVGGGSEADLLWSKLAAMSREASKTGMRRVTAGKLLARKRPRLIPIQDTNVMKVVQLRAGCGWWLSLRHALSDERLRLAIDQRAAEAGVPSHVSTLRVLDVILWMRGRG